MHILYIGGSGEISYSCLEESRRNGHKVTVYNRGKTLRLDGLGVEQIIGNFNDDKHYEALSGQKFDVVCQFLAYDVGAIERDIETFSGRCAQYIFISTASAYQKPCVSPLISEDTPLNNPFWFYSRNKADCEWRLLAAHRVGKLAVTIVRPSHTYRERLPSTVIHGDHLAWRLQRDKPVIVHGDGESVWTLTHAEDFARAFVQLFGKEEALGECFHITDSIGHTWNAIIKTVAREIGRAPRIVNVLSKQLVAYDNSWLGPLFGDKSNTMLFDNRKVSGIAIGWSCEVSLEEGIKRTWPFVEKRLQQAYHPDERVEKLVDRIVEEHS